MLFLLAIVLSLSQGAALQPATGTHAMIATEQHLATEAGIAVLKRGGNAVDAAAAVGYALAVVDPCCGNIGGGGFMLIRLHDGRERFIDFREKAPMRATRDMFLDKNGNVDPNKSRRGWLSIGIPGSVKGMNRALREYGTMSREAVMAPAIALARNGYRVAPGDMIAFNGLPGEGYNGWPGRDKPYVGEVFKQPDLAHSLALIARDGDDAFYHGAIAHEIVDASEKHGGILSLGDFAAYTVEESLPVHCSFQGMEVISAPPPSSGGVTLCEIINIVAPFPFATWGWHSTTETHYLVEAERRAYADRNNLLGDPAFIQNPIAQLLDPEYAAKLRSQIDPVRATPSSQVHPGIKVDAHEGNNTTHYSIVDKDGNAVGVTYTINDWFGSGVVAEHTGFILNDEMDDFTAKPGAPNLYGLVQGERNEIQPGKRPLSTMTPTMLVKDGRLVMVTGSPGGSRITTIALETILNVFDFGMNVQQAVDAPRMHMQWLPDEIQYEEGAFSTDAMTQLQSDGYAFKEITPFFGSAQAVFIDQKTGMLFGGSDRRHPAGAALGY